VCNSLILLHNYVSVLSLSCMSVYYGRHQTKQQQQQQEEDADEYDGEVRCRYLLCPASSDVSLLKKFVFLKFDLSQQQHAVSISLPLSYLHLHLIVNNSS